MYQREVAPRLRSPSSQGCGVYLKHCNRGNGGGKDSAKWFGQPELHGNQVFGVNRHEESAWEI